MADNITLNAGTGGSVLATDDDGAAHHQLVKMEFGEDGTQTLVSSSNPLPVDGSGVTQPVSGTVSVSGTVTVDGSGVTQPVSGTVTANLSATDNAVLDTIDAALDAINAKLVTGTVIGDVNLGATDNAVLDSIVTATQATQAAVEGTLTVTGGGGGTEYNEDDASPATIVGTAGLMERDDALATLTPVEGDWAGMRCSAEGALWTQDFNSDANLAAAQAIQAAVEGTLTVGAHAVTNAGTFAVQEDGAALTAVQAVQTAVQIMDDWDESDRAKVNLIAGQAGIAGGTGVDGATVPRVSLATDVALPAGTNAIGKLAANSGVDIGDVDVTSVPQPSSHYRNIDANAEDEIKGSGGTLYWLQAINLTAAIAYLHLYDATAASVTPGSTTPNFTFAIPTQGDTNGAGFNLPLGPGQVFANGITLVCTTTLDGSAGDPGTNGVIVNAGYA